MPVMREGRASRIQVGPDGRLIVPVDDAMIYKPLPQFLVQRGDFLEGAPIFGGLEDPSKPLTEVVDRALAIAREVLLGDKPQQAPYAMATLGELFVMRLGVTERSGRGQEHTDSHEDLDDGTVALVVTVDQFARARAVADLEQVQALPEKLAKLRQLQRAQHAAQQQVDALERGIVEVENEIDPVVRDNFKRMQGFSDMPELWDSLEPVHTLVSGAAERGQKTRDLRKKAHDEGFKDGFAAGLAAAKKEAAKPLTP